MKNIFKNLKNKKSGYALLSTILTLAVIAIIGTSLILVTFANFNQATVLSNYEKSYYESEAMLVIASDAVKKSATSKITMLQQQNMTQLPQSFLSDVINDAKGLLSQDILASSIQENGVFLRISPENSNIIEISAISKFGSLRRQTKQYLDLNLSTVPIEAGDGHGGSYFNFYDNISIFIGGDIVFPAEHSASTSVQAYSQGVILGSIVDSYAYLHNFVSTLPPDFAWWDETRNSIIEQNQNLSQGQIVVEGDIIYAKSINQTLQITTSQGFLRIGSRSFPNLNNMILIVDGNVQFASNLMFNTSRFTNFMVFASGNITIDSSARNNSISDNMFLFSGGNLQFTDLRGGGDHNLTFYTRTFHYIDMQTGSTKPTFRGQFFIKENAEFSVNNGNLTVEFIYDQSSTSIFRTNLNALANEGIIDGNVITEGSGGVGNYGSIFEQSKIVESVVS